MSRFFLLVVAGLLLFAAARAGAAESPFLGGFLQESRVVYPLQLGQWQAGAEQRYTEQEEGASINYRDPAQPGALLSVYFYPAGQLAPGQLQQVARQTLDDIVGLAGNPQTRYRTVEAAPLQRIVLPGTDDEEPAEAWLATMRITSATRTYDSVLAMLVKDLYFIKLRLSTGGGTARPAALRDGMERLLRELDERTRIVSTGECWNPLPVIAREHLDPAAEGQLLRIDREDETGAMAFADRVEALDPGSAEATVVQALASALSGRIARGCVEPADINPEVPDGMRELRFEYRRPQRPLEAAAAGRS